MSVIVSCPDCSTKLRAPDYAVGRKVKCPRCGGVIPVPATEEEVVEPLIVEVTADPPPRAPASRRADAAPPKTRRARDDDEDRDGQDRPRRRSRAPDPDAEVGEEQSPRRRSRTADPAEEVDEEESPRRRKRRRAPSGLQVGLGIASLSVGLLALFIFWAPFARNVMLPVCAVSVAVGLAGLIIAIIRGSGHAFPIAGCEVSGIALAVSGVWLVVTAVVEAAREAAPAIQRGLEQAARDMQPEMEDLARQMKENMEQIQRGVPPNRVVTTLPGEPTPPLGDLTLANGKTEITDQLVGADPIDRMQRFSKCKVYTLRMTAGKTYQIDMISDDFDAYLRLENSKGQNIAWDDDSGGNLNARIDFVCQENGAYRVVATAFDGGVGSFRLRIHER